MVHETTFKRASRDKEVDGAVRTTQDWSSRCVRGEVSQSRISRQIFVAHRMGKFPGVGETRDASAAILAGVAALAGAAVQRHSAICRTECTGPGALLN